MARFWYFGLSCFIMTLISVQVIAQNVDVVVLNSDYDNDEIFYNNVQAEIANEVKEAREHLVNQAKIVDLASKNYVAAKVKQNFFKALRVLAEKELERRSMQSRLRQPRQAEDEEDATDDAEATTARTVPLIPVVANVLKAVFGGSNQTGGAGGVNLTYHLQSVSNLINNRINGIGTGINNGLGSIGNGLGSIGNLFGLGRTTPAPVRIIQIVPVPVSNASSVDPIVAKLLRRHDADQDDLNNDVPAVDYFVSNTTDPSTTTTTARAVTVNQTRGPEPVTAAPGVIYIDALTKDVQEGLDGLIKAMPDLFKGAREAINLITTLREFLDD